MLQEENRTVFSWQDPGAPPSPELGGFVPITYSTTDIVPLSTPDAHDTPDPLSRDVHCTCDGGTYPCSASVHTWVQATWHGSCRPQTHLRQEATLRRVPQRLPLSPHPVLESPLIYHINKRKKKYQKNNEWILLELNIDLYSKGC